MKKAWILKDASGKYYTGRYDAYWTKDPDNAMNFYSEQAIENEFKNDESGDYEPLGQAEFPIEAITIYIK